MLQARDPALTRSVLVDHQTVMEHRLADAERIVAELQSGTSIATHTPVHVRSEPAVHALRAAREAKGDELWPWLEQVFARFERFLGGAGAAPLAPCSALYLPEIADDDVEPVEAFIALASPIYVPSSEPDLFIGKVPAADVAVLVHAGGYDSIGETYRLLGAWVARHGEPSGERIREHYVVGPPEATNVDDYRMEICWPVHRR